MKMWILSKGTSSALTQFGYEKSGFLSRNVMHDAEELKETIRCLKM